MKTNCDSCQELTNKELCNDGLCPECWSLSLKESAGDWRTEAQGSCLGWAEDLGKRNVPNLVQDPTGEDVAKTLTAREIREWRAKNENN